MAGIGTGTAAVTFSSLMCIILRIIVSSPLFLNLCEIKILSQLCGKLCDSLDFLVLCYCNIDEKKTVVLTTKREKSDL